MSRFQGFGRFVSLLVVLAVASVTHADKTLMFLEDEYLLSNTDSIGSVPRVWIDHYDSASAVSRYKNGYAYTTSDVILSKTNAYAVPIPVHTTDAASIPYPRQLERWWYSLPNFNSSGYREGKIRINMEYKMVIHRWLTGNPDRMQIDTQSNQGNSTTSELNSPSTREIDKCIDQFHGDTVWFRHAASDDDTVGVISNNPSASALRCYDHNPFFKKVGTIHLLNPWPGKTVWVLVGTTWQPLYSEDGRQGWVTASIWQDPRSASPFTVRFANGNPATSTSVQYLDAGGIAGNATGAVIDLTARAGKDAWVIPPTTTAKPTVATTEPPVKLTLMIHRPAWSASALRVLWKGLDARFIAASTEYCDWFTMTFYDGAVPASIALRHPYADTIFGAKGLEAAPANLATFANWIDVNPLLAASGTLWLETDGNKPTMMSAKPSTVTQCGEKVLAFSTYDYSKTYNPYNPFMEAGPDDNCSKSGGKETKGLVAKNLNAKGRPVWTGKIACDIGTVADGPQNWFDTLVRNGKPMNAFTCVPLPLKLDAKDGYYKYSNQSFFPVDTFKTQRDGSANPFNDGSPNFGFCMHAKASFEYVPGLQFKFTGDDDVWVFIDKKLTLDLGGQHGPVDGDINLDNIGLTEGKSYQFDMFYCERHRVGSTISIQTTMNLVPTIDVLFDSSAAKPGQYDYVAWTLETTNRADICPEIGAATSTTKRRGQASYVLVAPDLSETVLDSMIALGYSKGLKITDLNSHIWIDTTQLKKYFVQSGVYQIRISVGTEERVVSFSVSSDAVNVRGVILDANGDGQPDSVVLRAADQTAAFKNTAYAVVRWADRAGVPDSAVIPSTSLTRLPGIRS